MKYPGRGVKEAVSYSVRDSVYWSVSDSVQDSVWWSVGDSVGVFVSGAVEEELNQ